jgi:nucleoside-diphosphate-sugar epimerase
VLERVAGRRPGREYKEARPGELRHSSLDATRLRKQGWTPGHTLEQGLDATYRHIAAQKGIALSPQPTKAR